MLTDILRPFTFQAPTQDLAIKYVKPAQEAQTTIVIGLVVVVLGVLAYLLFK